MCETISSKSSQLLQILVGKANKKDKHRLFDWEPLLDSFFAFIDVCCNSDAQKKDKNVANFIRKYKSSIEEIKQLRVKITDFEIVKTIGRGHFGEVHVVKEKITGDIYAMKILKKASTLSQDNMAFYEEERDIMAFAGSPWVTALQYAFQDVENLYLVMEFHPGGDLLTLLHRYDDGIMEEDDCRFYLGEIIMAVHAVHVIGYVHRDVKPENILLDRTGHIKLADFGSSARLISGRSVVCKMPVGTPEYIAPEVLQSMNSGGGIYGCECDWWSVGVVAYEMLLGCLPFEADSVLQLYSQIMNFKNSLEFPSDVDISSNAKAMILGLLEDQKQRIGYTQLACHEFFKSLDWTTLKNVRPPYIPDLKDSTDTSHFGDFKSTKSTNQKEIQPTLASALPFLGFTFTKSVHQAYSSESRPQRMSSINSSSAADCDASACSDRQLSDKIKELGKLQSAYDQLQASHKNLQSVSIDNDKRIKQLESECSSLSSDNRSKDGLLHNISFKLENSIAENINLKMKLESLVTKEDGTTEMKRSIDTLSSQVETDKKQISMLECEKTLADSRLKNYEQEIDSLKKKCSDSEQYWSEYEKVQVKTQREMQSSISELQQLLEKTMGEGREKAKTLSDECSTLRFTIETLEKKLATNQKERQNLESQLQSMNNEVSLKPNVDALSSDLKALTREKQDLRSELSESVSKYDECKERVRILEESCQSLRSELETKNITVLKLNQSIRALEGQVKNYSAKESEMEKGTLVLKSRLEVLDDGSKRMEEENVNLRRSVESKDQLIHELKESCQKSQAALNDAVKTGNEKVQELQRQLYLSAVTQNDKDLEISSYSVKATSLEENLTKKETEVLCLVDDVGRLTTLIAAQKASNFKLTQDLEEANSRIRSLEADNDEVNSRMDRVITYNKEQVIKLEGTISQQNKLIDFLNPKKGMKKSKTKPVAGLNNNSTFYQTPSAARKPRDYEHQLELERMETLRLNNEINNLRQEITSLKSCLHVPIGHRKSTAAPNINDNRFTESPAVSTSDASQINEVGVMTDAYRDHTFQPEVCTFPFTCPVCFVPIMSGKTMSKCKSCKFLCHSNCDSTLPPNCSCGSVEVFPNVIEMAGDRMNVLPFTGETKKVEFPVSGYLSIPHKIAHNKYDWQKKWFVLSGGDLAIYNKNSDSEQEQIGKVNFSMMSSSCYLHPAVHTSDIIFATPASTACLIFGLEIPASEQTHSTLDMASMLQSADVCHPQNTIIYMMVSSLEDKRQWIRAFGDVLTHCGYQEKIKLESPITVIDSTKVQSVRNVVPICNDGILIGSSEGVFFYSTQEKLLLPCLPSPSFCYCLAYQSEYLFAILGEKRCLMRLTLEKHKKVSKISVKASSLGTSPVGGLNECYVVHSIDVSHETCTLIVSRSSELVIVKISGDSPAPKLTRISVTSPIHSAIQVDNQLYMCQEKFYVYDILSNERKEFLDVNDHSLAFIIFGSSPINNYPVDIFKMNRIPTQVEFLICCSEYGLIVDQQGKRATSGDLRWEQIPVSFYFSNLRLFICYSNMIEVRQFQAGVINVDLSVSTTSIIRHVISPRMVGCFFQCDGVYVCGVKEDLSISLQCFSPISVKRAESGDSQAGLSQKLSGTSSSMITDQSSSKHSTKAYRLFQRKSKKS